MVRRVRRFRRLRALVDEIPPGVGIADVAEPLHAVLLDAVGDGLDHQRGRLSHAQHPAQAVVRDGRRDRRYREVRNLQLVGDGGDRVGGRSRRGSDQHVDLVLLDELACVARRGGRIGAVVELNYADRFAADLAHIFLRRRDPAAVGNADRRGGAAQRGDEPDLVFRAGGRKRSRGQHGGRHTRDKSRTDYRHDPFLRPVAPQRRRAGPGARSARADIANPTTFRTGAQANARRASGDGAEQALRSDARGPAQRSGGGMPSGLPPWR